METKSKEFEIRSKPGQVAESSTLGRGSENKGSSQKQV